MFSGRISQVTCPRIAVLGTDGAIGKRTTATILTAALNERGIKAVLVGTGQTGLIQGARYGVALDAIPCQFCSGELESTVVEAFEVREGILPNDLEAAARATLRLANLTLRGIWTNLACHSGVAPDNKNMAELSTLTASLESTFGIGLETVSGGTDGPTCG